MPRRESEMTIACCPVTPRERLLLEDVKAACALDSDANLVRSAIYHFAIFVLGARNVNVDMLRLRVPGRTGRTVRHRARVGA